MPENRKAFPRRTTESGGKRQYRVSVSPTDDFTAAVSVWSMIRTVTGKKEVTLLVESGDLHPAVGWQVRVRGRVPSLVVEAVDGLILTCSGGAP